ncbi:gustatory receptor candidate 7 [Culex quinquefasciatus]|uniref:Gustatory receptor n=1 Tax=Culex quinquefasciatus TaxID=7176 RepID=B0XAJ6_CULQU|nr:gustatory receptor candidate 7 [Culex quinquefasciatus]|eukprot:XP_001866668.1 gustatory receptor candidate 7 [Culex quinquefasciatus]
MKIQEQVPPVNIYALFRHLASDQQNQNNHGDGNLDSVQGVFAKDIYGINFRWRSLRTLYSLFFLVLGFIFLCTQINLTVLYKGTLWEVGGILYFGLNLTGAIYFLIISRKWRSIMIRWKSKEDVFLRPPYRMYGRSLKFKIRLIGFSVIILAIIEESLHLASTIKVHHKYINFCNVTGTFWELYYNREHTRVFKYVSYNVLTVLLVEFTHKVYLFIWSFMDLFITLISIGLLTRFEQFYQRIEHLKGKSKPEVFWAEVRGDYTKISSLVTYLDEILSPMILITCASDVFFITFQLYMTVRMKTTSITKIYYRFSLIFLIFRALLMLLISSHVYVASRKPLKVLRAVPMSSWSTSMAGTLITYELVMLSEEKPLENSNICG